MSTNASGSAVWVGVDEVGGSFGPRASPPNSKPLKAFNSVIFIGFTGAGKTTALRAFADRRVVSAVLPDRRALTDKVILPAMTGEPEKKVTDRLERFKLTAAFRERYSGGMGDVLEQLVVPATLPDGLIAFDGLRGRSEINAALRMPRARFVFLKAGPGVRLMRLCERKDPFDHGGLENSCEVQIEISNSRAQIADILNSSGILTLLSDDDVQRLASALDRRHVAIEMVRTAASIVVNEAKHYPSDELEIALNEMAADRTLVLDSGILSPDDIVDRFCEHRFGSIAHQGHRCDG